MSRTRVETRARARALQALYAWDMRGEESTGSAGLEPVADRIWDDLHVAPDERERAVEHRRVEQGRP